MNRDLLLKAAFRDLVAAAGGVVRAARLCRVDAARLSRYGAPHEPVFAPIDVIADLEAEVGEPIVTRVMADLTGNELVGKVAGVADSERFSRHLGEVAGASGELIAGLGAAVGDGVVDARERDDIKRRAKRAQTEIAELVADLDRELGE